MGVWYIVINLFVIVGFIDWYILIMNEWKEIVWVVEILLDKLGKIVCFIGVFIVFSMFLNVVYKRMMKIGILLRL